ncbi:MAG: hypothetical protein C0620_04540 [Desulfuromonas sp.]|nr:MAG: hypothetical protein C0620_04540 [Desulfuromonas sp.]
MEGILKISTLITAFLIIVVLAQTSFSDQTKESAAISVAENFLQLVDSGRYSESWDATSKLFKSQISKQEWAEQLDTVRPLFGNIINRKIEDQKYTKSLPGAPDGEYVVIQFSTEFENKKKAIETVTPMLESDGEWRVSGYYIR